MSHPRQDVLSAAFLQSHGVIASKPLRDWLTRVSFLARAQPDEAKRARYEKWALHTVEEAATAPGGIAAVKWAKQSTTMPLNTSEPVSQWWSDGRAASTATTGAAPSTSSVNSPSRAALLEETLRRAPAPLQPFVQQGFSLYDREVARGQRTYEQVTFVEMLNIAKSLLAKAPPPPPASSSLPPAHSSSAPPAVVSSMTAAPAPLAVPATSLATAAHTAHSARVPPARPPAASPTPIATTSSPTTTHKRSAPSTGFSEESPRKRYAPANSGTEFIKDRTFFFQLLGLSESETPPPPVFVGQSTELERKYTRYEPLVEDIRPLPVLKAAFAHIQQRSSEVANAENAKAGQKYLSDQLKGLRQDLRVQNIVCDFTVMVYETHARLCLEMADIGEFNQCQAALKQFYKAAAVNLTLCHPEEFFLYRLVYLTLSEQHDSLSTELIHFTNAQLKGVTRPGAAVDKESVDETLALCGACINGDTSTIGRLLLLRFPVEMAHLVRIYLQKLRIMWLKEILTAMKGSLTMRFLMASLGFTPLQQGKQTFWLDGSAEEAAAQLTELFKTLKVDLPSDFTFAEEVTRTKHSGPHPDVRFPSLDATAALKAVDEYIVFLGTRKDAGLG